MEHLIFELSEGDDGVVTFEAMASTPLDRHAAVRAEADRVLAWARERFPHTQGPIEEGHDWDHDLQVTVEDGGRWYGVTLTLSASPRFAEAFRAAFVPPDD